jgi:hypothetical protein
MKLFLVILLIFLTLQARENPFFPLVSEKDIPYTSNEKRNISKLKRVAISLPSQARVIKKVTIEYKNLDGSIENKSIELENLIDWHLPIFISQNFIQEQQKNSITKKKDITNLSFKEVAKIKFAKFEILQNRLKITTTDNCLRDFLLVQPHRIVIDFKRDSNMKSYLKKIQNSVFTKIRIGNHNGYYRVVIELDGYYKYKLKTKKDGYLIILR